MEKKKKAVKALLSENWPALHYAPVRISNQIKESWIQWTPRHLVLHNVCRKSFFLQNCLFIVCTLTQISDSIVELKIGWNCVKAGANEMLLSITSTTTKHANGREMIWVSCQCHQTYLCAARGGRQPLDKARALIVICFFHCVDHQCYNFIIWAAWDEFAIIKPGLQQQW